MKLTAFDEFYGRRNVTGGTTFGSSSGSNSALGDLSGGGDVVGTPGNYTVVGLRRQVSLGSNIGGTSIGDVLTITSTSPRIARFATPSNAGARAIQTIAASGASQTLNVGTYHTFEITLTADTAIDYTGWVNSDPYATLWFTEDGTGGWEPTLDGTWFGDAPVWDTSASSRFGVTIYSPDLGTTVWLVPIGSDSGGTALTVQEEGVSLSTAADTLNFVGAGVTASGTGSTKTITIPSGGGHILLADGHGTPFSFNDLLQMDDGSDFMWSDP